jgi:hypothetical protein
VRWSGMARASDAPWNHPDSTLNRNRRASKYPYGLLETFFDIDGNFVNTNLGMISVMTINFCLVLYFSDFYPNG